MASVASLALPAAAQSTSLEPEAVAFEISRYTELARERLIGPFVSTYAPPVCAPPPHYAECVDTKIASLRLYCRAVYAPLTSPLRGQR